MSVEEGPSPLGTTATGSHRSSKVRHCPIRRSVDRLPATTITDQCEVAKVRSLAMFHDALSASFENVLVSHGDYTDFELRALKQAVNKLRSLEQITNASNGEQQT